VPVAHACNPSYPGGRDQEDHSFWPAQTNSSLETLSCKYPTQKRAGKVAQVVEHLSSKCETLNSNPPKKTKKQKKKKGGGLVNTQ
jgi:hypothetical protein